uniref:DUF7032 domain-containing protein n=1 Tax=Zea mays TaxID=4577 RepID=A0A804UIH5_MAIZE
MSSASLSATLFPLKWQLIRDRLNRLHAGLAHITVSTGDENRYDAFENLLRDVAAAAREVRELVPRSQGGTTAAASCGCGVTTTYRSRLAGRSYSSTSPGSPSTASGSCSSAGSVGTFAAATPSSSTAAPPST